MGRKRRAGRQAGGLRHEKKVQPHSTQHTLGILKSLLLVQRAAYYCIDLPQPANHLKCKDRTRTTISSTGQHNEPDIFA